MTRLSVKKSLIRRSLALLSALSLLLLVELAVGAAPTDAHGASTRPGSRTYLCRIDGTHASGDINPSNPACGAAVALGGKQPLWDWFGVLRSDGGGRTVGYIPDGQLCSGGEPKYAGYDLPRTDWPYTRLTSGATFAVRYNAWAAHPGEFRLYVTKDGYDPTRPLRWSDLEDAPFSVYNQNSPNGNDAQNGTPDYQWNVTLPNKTGQHIIYSVWSRSDSQETFYGCSDVRFDGGNGQVVGVGAGANPVGAPNGGVAPVTPTPTTPTPTTTPPPTTTPTTGRTTTPAPSLNSTTVAPTPASAAPTTAGQTGSSAAGGSGYTTPTTAAADGATTAAPGQADPTQPAATGSQAGAVGVAGTSASTEGVVVIPADGAQGADGVAAPADADVQLPAPAAVSAPAEGAADAGSEIGTVASDGSPGLNVTAPAAGQDQDGGGAGWLTVIVMAVAGLVAGIVLSVAAYSSPRARRIFRRLTGEDLQMVRPASPVPPRPRADQPVVSGPVDHRGPYDARPPHGGGEPTRPLAITSHR